MKRSEMLQLLYGKLTKEFLINKTSVYDSTEKILTFLEEQGMRSPPREIESYLAWIENEQVVKTPYTTIVNEWEPEDDR